MTTQGLPLTGGNKHLTKGILIRGGQLLFMFIFLGLVLFLSAGTLHWTAAWVYLGISLLVVAINSVLLLRTNPETVAERGLSRGWQNWDKLVSGLFALFQYLILPLVAGLDFRYYWPGEIGTGAKEIGGLFYTLSMAGSSWSMITNAYFSTAARIQTERGQQVCRAGPYKIIRHPGYASIIIQSFSTAILLGSRWALIPAACAAMLIVVRTIFEDRMLHSELAGYTNYASKVRYRLIPGVW